MHIAFLGNCHVNAVRRITDTYVVPYAAVTTDFIDAFNNFGEAGYQRLQRADVVVSQHAVVPRFDVGRMPPGALVIPVPVLRAPFLWPYHTGVRHPIDPRPALGEAPYHPEYNDAFLVDLMAKGVAPAAALARYQAMDVAAERNVGRIYELTLRSLRERDAAGGTDYAGIIESSLRQEKLFQSPQHFEAPIARYLTEHVWRRIGIDKLYIGRMQVGVKRAPFVLREPPLHPSITRFFRLAWANDDTRYLLLSEGGYTWPEYVIRFMTGAYSRDLEEGIIEARRKIPGAREKLVRGLAEAPRSAWGRHELSRLLQEEGDIEAAIALQREAVALADEAMLWLRLGELLTSRDPAGAETALRRAVAADPFSFFCWRALRGLLSAQARFQEAIAPALQAAMLARDRAGEEAVLAAIRRRAGLG